MSNLDPRMEALFVKVADGVASPGEREELMSFLVDKPELYKELEEHRALNAVTRGWVQRLELDAIQDAHDASGMTRAESGLGISLLVGGLGLLGAWGMVEAILEPSAPLAVRLGVAATLAGTAVLLVGVIRWRLRTSKSDRYTEVIR